MGIADAYGGAGHWFGTAPENTAGRLFTFVMHPRMPPTNNEFERILRRVVIHRKICQRIATARGMRAFGILMTGLLIWRSGLDGMD